MKFLSDYPELLAQWHPTKNRDVDPRTISHKSNKKYWFKCPIAADHEWESVIYSMTNNKHKGNGCPCCHGLKVVLSNCLATTHPDIAKQWHPTKNGNLTSYDVTAGSNKKVWFKCYDTQHEDHEWEAVIGNVIINYETNNNYKGCPCCSGKKAVLSNCLATTHPDIAKQWHPTKNGKLTPYNVTAGSGLKVWWKCPIADDHEWEAVIDKRTRLIKPTSCPCCTCRKIVLSNCLATTYPEIAKMWHPIKNGNITPYDVTTGLGEKYWFKCPVADDHEWEATLNSVTKSNKDGNNGCSCCAGRKAVLSNCLATTHKEIAKTWHPTRNGNLTPYDVTFGSGKRVWWICEKGHEWHTLVSTRSQGIGCPVCNESKGEKKVAEHLDKLELFFERQYTYKECRHKQVLPFDFMVKLNEKNSFLIEYQGQQHYELCDFGSKKLDPIQNLLEIQQRDKIKKEFCNKNNIPLLVIPYWEFDKIEDKIDEFITKIL